MQKITLIGRPVALPQLRPGTVFALPRQGGSTVGIRVAGADVDASPAWVCLGGPDRTRHFQLVREPLPEAAPVFAFPSAGTSIDPQSLLPVEGVRRLPGMLAMTGSRLLVAIRGEEEDAFLLDLESGALVARVTEPAAYACRWRIVVLNHGDEAAPLVSVDVTPAG